MRKSFLGLVYASIVFCFCQCQNPDIDGNLHFRQGVLDLTEITFKEDTAINLEGEWELYFGEFHYPPFHGKKELTGYLAIPNSWQNEEYSGIELPRTGKVTLRAFIHINKQTVGQELRIYIPDIASSYRFFANGVLIGGQGKPGINHFDDTPRIKSKYYTLIPDDEVIELVFHIANYENNFGGFWGVPILGNKYALDREKMFSNARELFLLGALSLIGLYHFGLFFYKRKEKSIFYFAIFCVLLGIRLAFTGERYVLELFPNFHWPTAFRIEFASYYFAVPTFLLFIHSLFPEESKAKHVRRALVVSCLFSFTLFLPISVFTILLYGFQILAFVIIGYVIHINLKAVINSRPNSKLFLIGLLILAFSVSFDILKHSLNSRGIGLTPYALLCFIFIQSLILSSRIANAFVRAEELAESLKISNESLLAVTENLEQIVSERTYQLNFSLNRIKKDLLLAKKIQQKILPEDGIKFDPLKIHLYFQPQDEVGGDFYDIFELDNGTVRFFVADATGHGIQAALYTMAIKSEYEAIKRFITKTDDLMNHLNQKIQNKFSGLKIVFSGFLLDIDTKTKTVYYSSAGHPNQIFQSVGNQIILNRTGNIIGLKKDQPYTQKQFQILEGDRILLFTDGMLEQKNEAREEFGMDRIQKILSDFQNKESERVLAELVIQLFLFQGKEEQEDDQTMVLIEWEKKNTMKAND
ncbi:protein phosphatase [Leptospira sp. mixed culture ATI2-C-A1]|nr:protein phosphatase [Leptospira sp. mixed culture ATI2-C-A1]